MPDLDDPAFGRAVRPLRRPPRRAARRGEPRHLGVLSRARRDHPPADRAARLQHRRGRGGLARRRARSTATCATCQRRRRRRAAVPALPDLDVAQHRRRRPSSNGCADTTQSGAAERRAGFYGLDIYNLCGSIAAVLDYLDKVDPEAAQVARERYGCLTPWQNEPATYGRAVLTDGYRQCEAAVVAQLRELLGKRLDYAAEDGESFLDAGAERAAGRRGRALLPHHVLRRRRELEPARPPHVRDARAPAGRARAGGQGRGVGAQLAHRRRALHRDGPRARRAQHRPALPRALRRARRR